jgi:signal transduction histidine kinase
VSWLDDAQRLEALLRSLPGLVVQVFDEDLRCTTVTGTPPPVLSPTDCGSGNRNANGYANGKASGYAFGISGGQGTGQADLVAEHMRAALDGEASELEVHDPAPPGDLWQARFGPVRGRGGEIIGGLLVGRKITQQRRTEFALLERNLRLDGLRLMATELLAGGGIDDALRLAVTLPRSLIAADAGVVVVPSDLRGNLVVRVCAGPDTDALAGTELAITGTAIGGVFERGQPVILPDVATGGEHTWQLAGIPARSVLLVPMAAEKRPIGVLGFSRSRGPSFNDQDLGVVESFGDQAAIALQHERNILERSRLALLEERERIARELHDGVIQMLYSTGLELQAIAQLTTGQDVAHRAEAVIDRLDQSIGELRAYIFALRPALLTGNPLDKVLEQFIAEFERVSGVITVFQCDPRVVRELEPVGADVVQVVRESLANVRRHAAAATCRVTLQVCEDGWLQVEIDDDGRGMPPGWSIGAGQGLRNLRQRAERHGGDLEVVSAPDEGTTVRFRIPAPDSGATDGNPAGVPPR